MQNTMELDCPVCDETNVIADGQDFCCCSNCRTNLRVNLDYDYEEGRWRNLSSLTVKTTT